MKLKTMFDFKETILGLYFKVNDIDTNEIKIIDIIDLRGRSELISYFINDKYYIFILNDYDIALGIIYNYEIYSNFIEYLISESSSLDFYDVRQQFYEYNGIYSQSLLEMKKVTIRYYYNFELNEKKLACLKAK
ncbi:hypothetical protein EAI30_08655 [Romboutsia ilealis]|uniref:Uncharacterized protein n=1 Tax=Romboutsia faecis TaxID=2764597 RepID=A0ABR7JPH4_9FIRM|nr:hypothetical protein [Romboutsia faecis]MBC5996809.1 hypothetical protein [Romboutsia faecis]MRN24685.1 hypothetical protein [Romboutsia ilealis]